jgi:hypothetical protein
MFNYLSSASPVLFPLAFAIAAEWVFFRAIKRQDGTTDVFELGVFYSLIVLIYCLFPGFEFLLGDMSFSVLGEFRLFRADPSPEDLAPIFWYYSIYLACFILAYWKFRGAERSEQKLVPRAGRKLLWVLVAVYAGAYLFFAVLKAVWNLRTPETYGETYLLYSNLPPVLQAVANHMIGIVLLLQLLLMTFLALNFEKYKRYIYGWLFIEFAGIALFGVGSRTGLMVLLLCLVVTYHRYVKRLSTRTVISAGVFLFLLFIGLGIWRALSSPGEDAVSVLSSGNEFDNVFANAYDLRELKATGQTDDIFPRIYFADFSRMLPDGLVPKGQLDPSQWYVQNFYPAYSDQGGGFAFGAISESIVGLGLFDVIWRALFVGWVFGTAHRLFMTSRNSFWNYAFYIWLTVFSYQTFRVTTFNLVPRALLILIIWWSAKILIVLFQSSPSKSSSISPSPQLPTTAEN